MLSFLQSHCNLANSKLLSSNWRTTIGADILKDPKKSLSKLFVNNKQLKIIVSSRDQVKINNTDDGEFASLRSTIDKLNIGEDLRMLKYLIREIEMVEKHANKREIYKSILRTMVETAEDMM